MLIRNKADYTHASSFRFSNPEEKNALHLSVPLTVTGHPGSRGKAYNSGRRITPDNPMSTLVFVALPIYLFQNVNKCYTKMKVMSLCFSLITMDETRGTPNRCQKKFNYDP